MNDAVKLLLKKVCEDGEDISDYMICFMNGRPYLVDIRVMNAKVKFIKTSEEFRSAINKSTSLMDIAMLGIICIGGMTGGHEWAEQKVGTI